MRLLKAFLSDTTGATAVEYGILAAFLSAAVIGGYTNIANSINTTFARLSTEVQTN